MEVSDTGCGNSELARLLGAGRPERMGAGQTGRKEEGDLGERVEMGKEKVEVRDRKEQKEREQG